MGDLYLGFLDHSYTYNPTEVPKYSLCLLHTSNKTAAAYTENRVFMLNLITHSGKLIEKMISRPLSLLLLSQS